MSMTSAILIALGVMAILIALFVALLWCLIEPLSNKDVLNDNNDNEEEKQE